MGSMDFYIDFNIEIPDSNNEYTREAEQSLRKLTSDRSDILGASVAMENLVNTENPHHFQVRIVVYKRPENIAVVEKGSDPMSTLKNALNAIQKNIRDAREKLAEVDPHHAGDTKTILHELSAEEIYGTYIDDIEPEEILRQGRTELASSLMVKEGLNQEEAYFTADQIFRIAQGKIDSQ